MAVLTLMSSQDLARCANPSLIHTNLAFTSILKHATPAYKAEIITFVHKIKLYVYFEKLSCLLREKEWKRDHSIVQYLTCYVHEMSP